ncbi:MAG: tol-pal system protein YbgF [Elusimicrobiota bacterium]|jgi:tol-pal system protein YbgF|nr:tol-pal system protein YbgF [Elusimicrobiota bacterium]
MKNFLFILLFLSIALTGCVFPFANKNSAPQSETAQLRTQIQTLQNNQNAAMARMDSMQRKTETMSSNIEELQDEVLKLKQSINDMQSENKNQDSINSISSAYQEAYSDFSAKKYDLAYEEFKLFVLKNPKSSFAANAQFYMGECFFVQKAWQKAADEYIKVDKNYPKSDVAAQSLLKLGLSYEHLNKKKEAIAVFASIVKKFPQSPESAMAKEKIKANNNGK